MVSSVGERVRWMELSYFAGGIKNGINTLKNWQFLLALNMHLAYESKNYDYVLTFYGTIEGFWSDELECSMVIRVIITHFCFKNHVSYRINSKK